MEIPERDGDGYLFDMSNWTPKIGRLIAEVDCFELTDKKLEHINKAREFYEEFGTVPLYGNSQNL